MDVERLRTEILDRFYAELRKRGGAKGQPLSMSTIRGIHFIISASLGLGVK